MNDQDRTKVQGTDRQAQADGRFDRDITYAFAHCEAKIEGFSRSMGIPFTILTAKVADLLYLSAGRVPMGAISEVRPVRRGTTVGPKRLLKVAVARRSYGSGARRVKVKGKHRGKGKIAKRGSIEPVIAQVMEEAQVPLSQIELAKRTGISRHTVNSSLHRMIKKGTVVRESRGQFRIAA